MFLAYIASTSTTAQSSTVPVEVSVVSILFLKNFVFNVLTNIIATIVFSFDILGGRVLR